jgi:RimJ/RimL family protein N-acetyltransferase
MIGDVNLFFKHQRDDPEFEVECEVMIAGTYSALPATHAGADERPLAEPAYRGQRRAHAALALLLSYARDTLSVRTESFVARIGASNARSIALFGALGFNVVRTVAVFDEVEMRIVDPGDMRWPVGQVREYP